MTILFFISSVLGILNNSTHIKNILLSLWVVYPILLLLLATYNNQKQNIRLDFINFSTKLVIIIDVLGFIYGASIHFDDPDMMRFAYGEHFARQNGLAIINILYFLFYLNKYYKGKDVKSLLLSFVFIVGLLLCECGLALICLLISCMFFAFLTTNAKYLTIFAILIILLATIVYKYSFGIGYYLNTLQYLSDNEIWEEQFRKIVAFQNYIKIIYDEPLYFFFGLGPGGYNSRIAFLLNTDSDNPFTYFMGNSMPFYHSKYIYPLWDKTVIDVNLFNDGSRNKPFSSFLSILSEYGIFMFILVYGRLVYWLHYFTSRKFENLNSSIVIILFFLLLMLLLDQWLETSELVFCVIFLISVAGPYSNSTFKLINNTFAFQKKHKFETQK